MSDPSPGCRDIKPLLNRISRYQCAERVSLQPTLLYTSMRIPLCFLCRSTVRKTWRENYKDPWMSKRNNVMSFVFRWSIYKQGIFQRILATNNISTFYIKVFDLNRQNARNTL